MKQTLKTLWIATLLTVLIASVGCGTLYKSSVTITSTVDAAMKGWAELSVAGKTGPDVDAKVKVYHAEYAKACGVAARALEAYKATGDKAEYLRALEVVRTSAADLFTFILPLLTDSEALKLETQLRTAKAL